MDISLSPHDFIWAAGIEDTFIPQTRRRLRALDEYELMGHYDHWREDLAQAAELGVRALRWGVPWYRVEPRPGEFDWTWTDQVIPYLAQDLGITPILDLIHYGCPLWLDREFVNPDYPSAVARYAGAFAQRYAGLVRWYTPLNEPRINSHMCGHAGLWPPYLRGDRGYLRVMMQLVKGMLNTVEVLRSIDPAITLVHIEAISFIHTHDPALEALAREEQLRTYLSLDLLTGKVTPDHPLLPWLLRNGVSMRDLTEIAGRAVTLDLVGINFYPQWSTHELFLNGRGKLASRSTEIEGDSFAPLIQDVVRRYGAGIMITETSAYGSDQTRKGWLHRSVETIKDLRGRGVPIVGYTWFPLFTMVDWRHRYGRGPVEDYYIELGLYTLARDGSRPRWRPSSLVEPFQTYLRTPVDAVGGVDGVAASSPQVSSSGPEAVNTNVSSALAPVTDGFQANA